jgi:hypothetical protein
MNSSLQAEATSTSLSSGRRRLRLVPAYAGLALIALGLALVNGCKRPATTTKAADPATTVEKSDPWEATAKKLRKDTDFSTCQSVLRTLNENLRNDDQAAKPQSLTPEFEKALAPVPLSPADRDEIHNWAYSTHDAAYLEECFYLRDVAQSLRIANLPPDQLADLAFAWVCRSVSLNAWLLRGDRGEIAAALPPAFVLRRGDGSALERMYVFLALLQQLDLDGCLVGPPGMNDVGVATTSAVGPSRSPLPGGPARPFWAVGVRLGQDVKLYDPWRGEAFPAALTLLKQNPDAVKSWLESPANLSGVKADDAKAATVYLAAPVNALSPRMDLLHQKVKDSVGVRLAINPTTVQAAFGALKPAYWNPPSDRFAYGRASRTFLPHLLGGTEEAAPAGGASLYSLFLQDQLPSGLKINLPELKGSEAAIVNDRLFSLTRIVYMNAFVQPADSHDRIPRERIQRGQFQDAIRDLISKQDMFSRSLELLRNTPDVDRQIAEWCIEAKQLYENLGRVILLPPSDRPAAQTAAQDAIENHWKGKAVDLMRSQIVAPLCKAEAVFLLSLCKHEMAERAQTRADHAGGEDAVRCKAQAVEAWRDAHSAWQTYLDGYVQTQSAIPERNKQARALAERAEKLAATPRK